MARPTSDKANPNWTCPKYKRAISFACPAATAGAARVEVSAFAIGNLQPSRYICGKCGFLEEYVDVPEHL